MERFIKVISNQLVSGRGDGNGIEGTFLNVIGNSSKVFGCHFCVTGNDIVVIGNFAQVKTKDNVVVVDGSYDQNLKHSLEIY